MKLLKRMFLAVTTLCLLVCGVCSLAACNGVAEHEHEWKVETTIPATETEEGRIDYACTYPGCKETKSEVIPKLQGYRVLVKGEDGAAMPGLMISICVNDESGACSMPATTDSEGYAAFTFTGELKETFDAAFAGGILYAHIITSESAFLEKYPAYEYTEEAVYFTSADKLCTIVVKSAKTGA